MIAWLMAFAVLILCGLSVIALSIWYPPEDDE